MEKLNQRPVPDAAYRDPDAVEMLRVWIAENRIHCSLKAGMYRESTSIPEEKAWGTILADVAKHIAKALEQGYGANEAKTLAAIRDAFAHELRDPTSEASGQILKRH